MQLQVFFPVTYHMKSWKYVTHYSVVGRWSQLFNLLRKCFTVKKRDLDFSVAVVKWFGCRPFLICPLSSIITRIMCDFRHVIIVMSNVTYMGALSPTLLKWNVWKDFWSCYEVLYSINSSSLLQVWNYDGIGLKARN